MKNRYLLPLIKALPNQSLNFDRKRFASYVVASLNLVLKTSLSTDSLANAGQVVVEFDEVDGGGGKFVKSF